MYLQRFHKVIQRVRNQFPNSPWITTQQAEDLLNHHHKVVFIDSRLKDEFKVSRIPRSINIPISTKGPEIKQKLMDANIGKNTKIINYCAISKFQFKNCQNCLVIHCRSQIIIDDKQNPETYQRRSGFEVHPT